MAVSFTSSAAGVRFAVKAVPGASRARIVGPLGEALKVAIAQPPEGGAANRAIVSLLAEALGVPERQVQIVRGHSSPRKQILVSGVAPEAMERWLGSLSARQD